MVLGSGTFERWLGREGGTLRNGVQFSSVAQLCPTLCDPMNRSTPGLPVHHKLLEFTQTHFHRVGDAIQSSHPLPSPSPPALNLSQHQGLFQWVNSLNEVAKVLEFQLQHQSLYEYPEVISFRMDWLDLLAVQRTLQSLLQHHGSKPSILWGLAGRFFTTEPSEKPPYISYILSISFLCKNKQRYPNHWVWCTISSSFLQYLLNWNP